MPEPGLTVERFTDFVAAVHGDSRTPFPWQSDLVARLIAHGSEGQPWPSSVDVPTGLGKTSVLDAAVYAAAAGLPLRRVFFVVDRRLVVDEAFEHAKLLERAVHPDADDVLGKVGRALAGLSGQTSGRVLRAARMRGGTTWDWRWMDRPDRFGIVAGTVDQLGSRVLFRGYGLSPRLAPIDAALAGTDAVWFVDEAHLAQPLLDTLAAARRFDHPAEPVARPVHVVPLSATQRGNSENALHFDVASHLHHPEARRRLRAGKALHTVRAPKAAKLPEVLAAAALAATALRDGARVGVVTNTVPTARAVFDKVREATRKVHPIRPVLLTGRQRPVDRDLLLYTDRWAEQLTVGWRQLPEKGAPVIVSATQTVEVGANLDFDVLITESAPWDSLIQRIGRLNRVGFHDDRDPAPVLVVHHEAASSQAIYGTARTSTWDWLTTLSTPSSWGTPTAASRGLATLATGDGLDVSPLAIRKLDPPEGTMSSPRRAPVLFRQHLDGWVRTAPIPIPDAPVAPFLHGYDDRPDSVRILWRADLPDLTGDDATDARAWRNSVRFLPPRAAEEVELPLPAARAWLRRAQPVPVTDDDNATPTAEPSSDRRRTLTDRVALRLSPDGETETSQLVRAAQLRPGDRFIVPTSYGGMDDYGWAPESTTEVLDVADLVDRRIPAIRIDRRTLLPLARRRGNADDHDHLQELLQQLDAEIVIDEGLALLPAHLPATAPPEPGPLATLHVIAEVAVRLLPRPPKERSIPLPRRIVTSRASAAGRDLRILLSAGAGRRATDTTTGSSASDQRVPLARHHNEVGALAAEFACRLVLPERIIKAVRLAGQCHDLGKLDFRFQTQLFGDPLAAEAALLADEPIAKSGSDPSNQAGRRSVRRASGYPERGRHEALSAILVQHQLCNSNMDVDAELVTHLVAAHHGNSRPLLPFVPDPEPPSTVVVPGYSTPVGVRPDWSVDWCAPQRFYRLGQRYGHWGLALLEAIVRLADIACSAGENTVEDRT